ncbi:MAG: ethanolamine ammonia-lyase subunit EutC [Comamonadaceae bacterium]
MKNPQPVVIASPWNSLKRFTDARIALGRAGHSLPTAAHLDFQLAHAQARDAVHLPLDALGVADSLEALGLTTLRAHSAAIDRATYLQRPDRGRKLDQRSRDLLTDWAASHADSPRCDVAFVVADGLSALAIHKNAAPLLAALGSRLQGDAQFPWSIGPVVVVEQGRVAIGDEVGELLQAKAVAVLIGERPGLSSPDSLGIYLTWGPHVGCNDAQRNCISNVRPAGLPCEAAAAKLHQLLQRSRTLQLTGVGLKDESEVPETGRVEGQ